MYKQCDLERVRAGDTRATRSLLLPIWKAVTWDKHKPNHMIHQHVGESSATNQDMECMDVTPLVSEPTCGCDTCLRTSTALGTRWSQRSAAVLWSFAPARP